MTAQTSIQQALAAHEGTVKADDLSGAARQLHKTMTKVELTDLARPKLTPKRFMGGKPTRIRNRKGS